MTAAGWTLQAVCTYSDRGYRRHHIWMKGASPAYSHWHRDDPAKLTATVADLRNKKLRPIWLHTFKGPIPDVVSGPDAGRESELHHSLTADQLSEKVNSARANGWRPDRLLALGTESEVRFAVLFLKQSETETWDYRQAISEAEYEQAVAVQRAGRMPASVASWNDGSGVHYSATWLSYSPNPPPVDPPPRPLAC